MSDYKKAIVDGKTYLGIEFGSTRIKAVLIDEKHSVIASGSHSWENRLENGIWTYSLDDIWTGLQNCYSRMAGKVEELYGVKLKTVGALGFSAMMHGYMVFDKAGEQLVPFRTWRNTITEESSKELTDLFGFNIPQRWSVAHLYQAILNEEDHINDITFITSLAGYIHWKLSGEKVLGIGDAAGIFPVNDGTRKYDECMMSKFNEKIENLPWNIEDIIPGILSAGENAGTLTEEGAKLLDPSGTLSAGVQMCPPEGDAGTGMVATNAVGQRTGNISAGTSVFAMVVLEKALSKVYPEIDMVTTPSGDAVAMVHCNNCSGDLDAWVMLMGEAAELMGAEFDINTLYEKLYKRALEGAVDCGGLLSYNYISGEHVTGLVEGRPMFMRKPDSKLRLAEFMRTHLYSACASLKIGMKILLEDEGAALDSITGHGGYFTQAYIGQKIMSAAMNAPVTVMKTASEGGPWGMAILAAYMINGDGESLPDYLNNKVFAGFDSSTVEPDEDDVKGFNEFIKTYQSCLAVEKLASESFKL